MDHEAVKNLSIEITEGEIYGLLNDITDGVKWLINGSNGAGAS